MIQTYTSRKFSKIFSALTILISILFSTASIAQKNPDIQRIYAEVGVGGTSYKGAQFSAGIHGITKNNWVIGFNYHSINMDPKNVPKDFEPGSVIVLFFPIPNPSPDVDMSIISLSAGKHFKTGRNSWLNSTAGLSLINAKEFNFTKTTIDNSWWAIIAGEIASNYTYTDEKKSTIGATLKADFNWAFSSFAGLGAGVFANFNSIQSPVGYNVKLIIGKTGREKRNRS
jgi:hypothetical protein